MKRKYFITSLVVMCMLLLFVTIFFTFFKTATFGEEKEVKVEVLKGEEARERMEKEAPWAADLAPFTSYDSYEEMFEATMERKDTLEEAQSVLPFKPVLPKETLGKNLVGIFVSKKGDAPVTVEFLYSDDLVVGESYLPYYDSPEELVESELGNMNQGRYSYAVSVKVNGIPAVAWDPTYIKDSEGYEVIVTGGSVR